MKEPSRTGDIRAASLVARILDTNSVANDGNKARRSPTEKPVDYPEVSLRDLGPIGRTVAGVTEVAFALLFEYATGFVTGLFFGTIVGVPGFLFRPVNPTVRQALSAEVRGRFARMSTRSKSWAKNYASISAAFGGCEVAVRVLRNGEEDSWSQILSSAAAGAFFARKGKSRRSRIEHHDSSLHYTKEAPPLNPSLCNILGAQKALRRCCEGLSCTVA
jgi:Tim17/Tim22/Tim23/Pmp24 family